ncbi:UDP-N-acetylglucosamine 1-carboxyvinyltransferase [Actinocorallia longicatena]|uniref:UDP-N-acetylglucosamine 1-carboxyvinyltransferase n=1 Tax=Actinocorallia longicatena TaxID=111803 RepID=A0ABP6QJY8_9ACTN
MSVTYRVRGGRQLHGTVFIQGAKNSALPMIGAALMAAKGRTVLRNVPIIEDVKRAVELAQAIGAKAELHEAERTLVIDASQLTSPVLPAEIAARFRGSFLFVPALLHRLGEAVIEGVGGCNLGSRNLDFHYNGFKRMGATVTEHGMEADDGYIHVKVGQLQGGTLYCDTPSHTGTENLVMAGALAHGQTLIKNAALEPEVLDNIDFLQRMGARITGGGTGFIRVDGVEELCGIEHTVMPDRIDAGVLVMAAAITGGEVSLVGADVEHLGVAVDKLEQMGVEFHQQGAVLQVKREKPLRPINIITDEYPGFATDLQSPIMALATQAEGESYIYERIFDARFQLAGELESMGASIELTGSQRALVHGPTKLRGAKTVAHDLRSGAALVLAGLVAEGETEISSAYFIDRGHSNFAERLNALGAEVERDES